MTTAMTRKHHAPAQAGASGRYERSAPPHEVTAFAGTQVGTDVHA